MTNNPNLPTPPQNDPNSEHDQSYEQSPFLCAVTGYEVSHDQPVPEEVQAEIEAFLAQEFSYIGDQSLTREVRRARQIAYLNHKKNWLQFNEAMGMDPDADASAYQDKQALLLVAREADGNRFIGFSSAVIRPENATVEETYVGVAAAYSGRGVGGAMFLLEATHLADLGVPSMEVSVWAGSEAMLKKAGIDYSVVESETQPPTEFDDRRLQVVLDRPALAVLCEEKLGFVPDPDGFTGTYPLTLPQASAEDA